MQIYNTIKYNVLVVDDDREVIKVVKRIFKKDDDINIISANTVAEAKDKIDAFTINLFILDCYLSDGNSNSIIDYANSKGFQVPTIIVSGVPFEDISFPIDTNIVSFSFFQKPFYGKELYISSKNLLRFFDKYRFFQNAHNIIIALSRALEKRDTYTEGHTHRVAEYALKLYDAVGYGDDIERDALFAGCLLHDIGKIAVPDEILNSSGKLTEEEMEIVKRHPKEGWEICSDIESLRDSLVIIRGHHEKLDGTGYPDNLIGDDIPDIVQMATIADIYDALTSVRSYRGKMKNSDAMKIMWEEASGGKISEYFLSMFEKVVLKKIDKK